MTVAPGIFTCEEDFAATVGFGAIEPAGTETPNLTVVVTKFIVGFGDACAAVVRVVYGFTVDRATLTTVDRTTLTTVDEAVGVRIAETCTSA